VDKGPSRMNAPPMTAGPTEVRPAYYHEMMLRVPTPAPEMSAGGAAPLSPDGRLSEED
jgi:hypothetical protein